MLVLTSSHGNTDIYHVMYLHAKPLQARSNKNCLTSIIIDFNLQVYGFNVTVRKNWGVGGWCHAVNPYLVRIEKTVRNIGRSLRGTFIRKFTVYNNFVKVIQKFTKMPDIKTFIQKRKAWMLKSMSCTGMLYKLSYVFVQQSAALCAAINSISLPLTLLQKLC